MSENIHSKHRDRVRKELLAHGFDSETPPHKILEMLLFYSIPRKDTNEIAHELINKFGSIEAVLKARPEELLKVSGVGENTVAHFKLMLSICYRIINDNNAKINATTAPPRQNGANPLLLSFFFFTLPVDFVVLTGFFGLT